MSMSIKSAVFCVAGAAALLGSVTASPSQPPITRVISHKTMKRQVQEITGSLGCDAKGPLSGPWAVELFTCETGSNYTCQATDSSGCTEGDAANVDSFMVFDSTTGQPLSVAPNAAQQWFECPENGLVQCAVHFSNNGSDSNSYGLRIINSTESTPFSNATFGADNSTSTDSSMSTPTDNSTDSATDSGFGSSPTDTDTDSGFGGDSSTDGGFGSSTPTDSGFGGSPTDSMGGSSSDGASGFGSPTDSASSGDSSGNPSSDAFDSQVFGEDSATGGSSAPLTTSSSSTTATSGFGSVPSDEVSGFA